MKTKPHKTERRGRKPGDGVLKTLDPQSTLLERQRRLTYGTADNVLAERVRWFRNIRAMMSDPKKPEFVDRVTGDNVIRFREQMVKALLDFKPDWFQQMADTIKAEMAAQDAYPLQQALLEIHGAPNIRRADLIYPENADGEPVALKPRYTITELCDILKRRGKRPANQEQGDFERTIRRTCAEIGIPILPGKPGRRRKKS